MAPYKRQGPPLSPFLHIAHTAELREIALLSAQRNFQIQPIWIPSQENLLADLHSGRDFKKLANNFPLLTQPTTMTHQHSGMRTSTYPASLPATWSP